MTDFQALSLEMQVLYDLSQAPSPDGYIWKFSHSIDHYLASGQKISSKQWGQVLQFLKREGLASSKRIPARIGLWKGHQQTITCYQISSKGCEILKGLGL